VAFVVRDIHCCLLTKFLHTYKPADSPHKMHRCTHLSARHRWHHKHLCFTLPNCCHPLSCHSQHTHILIAVTPRQACHCACHATLQPSACRSMLRCDSSFDCNPKVKERVQVTKNMTDCLSQASGKSSPCELTKLHTYNKLMPSRGCGTAHMASCKVLYIQSLFQWRWSPMFLLHT
jgi:hypothetical protein